MSTCRDLCRLCLQDTDPYCSRKIDMRRLCTLWKYYKFDKMDASLYRNHIICDACIDSLKALKLLFFSIKISQIEIDKELKKSGLTKIDLKKSNRYSSLEGQFFVCRLCFKPAKELALHLYDNPDNILPVDYISKMLKACKISMNFSNTINPVACHSCWENIQVGFSFRKQLEKINEKISLHSTALNKCVITREDLQKIVELYRFDDPHKELNLLLTKESRYNSTSTCKPESDLKHKVKSKITDNELNPNIFKKTIRDGPISNLHHKTITEYDDLQTKILESEKTAINPYYDIDKVVQNTRKLDQVPRPFSDINNQNVNNFQNTSQDLDNNSDIDVCENQTPATINIEEFFGATEKDSTSQHDSFAVRTGVQIKKEIIWEDEDVYVKSEVLSEHGADGFEDDDVFEEGGYRSEPREANIAVDNDDACPSLTAVIKNEPNQEDLDVYDIHYVEHFNYGPPVLAPEQPCLNDNPYPFDENRIQIEKVTSLNQNNYSSPKKVRAKKKLSVKNLIKEGSKEGGVPTSEVKKRQFKTKDAIPKTMVTRSASKNKSNIDIDSPELLKRKLPENLSNPKRFKKGTAGLLDSELIVDSDAQNVIPNKTIEITDPASNKSQKKIKNLVMSKSLKNTTVNDEEVINRHPVNKYNTRSSLKNTKNFENENKLLLNPVIQIKTKASRKSQKELINEHPASDKDLKLKRASKLTSKASTNKTVKFERKKEFYTEIIEDLPRLEHFEAIDYDHNKKLVVNLYKIDAVNKSVGKGDTEKEDASMPKLNEMVESTKKRDLYVNKRLNVCDLGNDDSQQNDPLPLENEIPLLRNELENSTETELEKKPRRKTRRAYFRFQCDLCDFHTTKQQGATLHKTLHKNNQDSRVHQCPACIYKTTSISRLKSHFKSNHPDRNLSLPQQDNLRCSSCGKRCPKIFNIKCKKCEQRFHPGCFAKTDPSCQHEEDFGFEIDHDYCLPSSIKQKRKSFENPPELQKIDPIIPPLSPSLIEIDDDTPPPLLERQVPMPMTKFKKTQVRNVSIAQSPFTQVVTKNNVRSPTPIVIFHSNRETKRTQNIAKNPVKELAITALNAEMPFKKLVNTNTGLHSETQAKHSICTPKLTTEFNNKIEKKQNIVQKSATTVSQNVTQTRLDNMQRSPQRLTVVEHQQVVPNPCSPRHTLTNARQTKSNPTIFESMYTDLRVEHIPSNQIPVDAQEFYCKPAYQKKIASKIVNPMQTETFETQSGVDMEQNNSFQHIYESSMLSDLRMKINRSEFHAISREIPATQQKVPSTSTKQNHVTMISEGSNSEQSTTDQAGQVGTLIKPMNNSKRSQTALNYLETHIPEMWNQNETHADYDTKPMLAKQNPLAIDKVQKRRTTSKLIQTSTKLLNLPQIPRIEKTVKNIPVINPIYSGSSTGLKRVLYPVKSPATKPQDVPQPERQLTSTLTQSPRTIYHVEKPFKNIPVLNPTHSGSSVGLKKVLYPLKKPVPKPQESKSINLQRIKLLKIPSTWVQNSTQQSSPPDINNLGYFDRSTCFDEKSKKMKQEVLDSYILL